ncbi:MAG: LysR family transcriptional regulator [Pseudomonadota bacterium]
MSRPKRRGEAAAQRDRPGLRVKVYIRDDMIGAGKVDLLRLVATEGSITGAAKAMGVDYKRAWFLLDTLQRCFAEPLFVTRRGGAAGQGAALTPLGEELIARHDAHLDEVNAASATYLSWLEDRQRPADAGDAPGDAAPDREGGAGAGAPIAAGGKEDRQAS